MFALCLPLNTSADDWEDKVTPQLLERLETANDNEVITVYVWMTDIDRGDVENQVYKETGYNMYNIEQKYETVSEEIFKFSPDSVQSRRMITENIELTATARAKELKATDTYIESQRRLTRDAYDTLNAENTDTLNIDEENIIFSSQYAPMIIADLTAAQIRSVAGSSNSQFLDLYVEMSLEVGSATVVKAVVEADKVESFYCLSGDGVKIGQYDLYMPHNTGVLNGVFTYFTGNFAPIGNPYYDHANQVCEIMYSFAPDADYYAVSYTSNTSFYEVI